MLKTEAKEKIDEILPKILKPSRYLGAEQFTQDKDPKKTSLKLALCFPDLYEIGISNLGLQILYNVLRDNNDVFVDRCYCPSKDLEDILRSENMPIFGLESKISLKEFDVVGFSLPHELAYSNVLNMIDLANLDLFAEKRDWPLIIAGGSCCFNPMPMADFIDAFVIGDGEEVLVELCNAVISAKKQKLTKKEALEKLTDIDGVYVPIVNNIAKKRITSNLNQSVLPVIPYSQAVHDRLTIEIMRGCSQGCRFCQASFINRPIREAGCSFLTEQTIKSLEKTGYEELSLLSLNTSGYSQVGELVDSLAAYCKPNNIKLSVPSQRMDSFSLNLSKKIGGIKKSGFTLAPEAGTLRLREVINKNLTDEQIEQGFKEVFSAAIEKIKLYFMIGLPTETMVDIKGIADIAKLAVQLGKQYLPPKFKRRLKITVSVSTFVPKPHTPFQWAAQDKLDMVKQKQLYLQENILGPNLELRWHDSGQSLVEGILARGGRNIGKVIYSAYKKGAIFDNWNEHFNLDIWLKSMEEDGLEIGDYLGQRDQNKPLPWSNIKSGVTDEFLKAEFNKALDREQTADCVKKCVDCGVCGGKIRHQFSDLPADRAYRQAGRQGFRHHNVALTTSLQSNIRLRLFISKQEPLNYLSHLEFVKVVERALRRSKLPLSFTSGFNPRVKMSFSPALSTGYKSAGEVFDVFLNERVDFELEAFKEFFPRKIFPISAYYLEQNDLSISKKYKLATYQVKVIFKKPINEVEIEKGIDSFIAQKVINIKTKRSKRNVSLSDILKSLKIASFKDKVLAFELQCLLEIKPSHIFEPLLIAIDKDFKVLEVERVKFA